MTFDSFPVSLKFEESHTKGRSLKDSEIQISLPFHYEIFIENDRIFIKSNPKINFFSPCDQGKLFLENDEQLYMLHPCLLLKIGWDVPFDHNDGSFALVFATEQLLEDHQLDETNHEISMINVTENLLNIRIGAPEIMIRSNINFPMLLGSGPKCHSQTPLLKPEHCKITHLGEKKWCIEPFAKDKYFLFYSWFFSFLLAFGNLLKIQMKFAQN